MPFYVTLEVYNSAGERVRSLFDGYLSGMPTGSTLQPAMLVDWTGVLSLQLPTGVTDRNGVGTLTWDGSNDGGQAVSNGSYWFKFETYQSGGQVADYSLGCLVNRPDNADSLGIYNSAGERVASLPLPAGADADSFSLSTHSGSSFDATVPLSGGGTSTVHWDGLNADGQPVDNGVYSVRAEAHGSSHDEAFTLLHGPSGNGSLMVGPNPLGPGQGHWILRFDARPGQTAVARLYDLAGEAVRQVQGPANGSLNLDARGLAGGIYLLRLDVDGAQAYHRSARLAVIH